MSTTATKKVYPFAVIPSSGCTGGGAHNATSVHETAHAARMAADRLTAEYRRRMAAHGGSSGGYTAVEWGKSRNATFWDDMRPDAI